MENNPMDIQKIKYNQLLTVSNPRIVQNNLNKYLGNTTDLYVSNRNNKKYMIKNPKNNKWVHFGDIRYEDFTRHLNTIRRNAYLRRATAINGDWENDVYSPNNLSIFTLWNIL
jgi:hypothetical protein